MASNHPGCLFFIEAIHASTAFRLYMHSLEGFGFPSGETCTYSRPTIQHSFLARRMVPGFSPVTAIRTFSQTQSFGTKRTTSLILTSHHTQTTAVAPDLKHPPDYLPTVKPFNVACQVIAVSIPLAHMHLKCLVQWLPPFFRLPDERSVRKKKG